MIINPVKSFSSYNRERLLVYSMGWEILFRNSEETKAENFGEIVIDRNIEVLGKGE